MAKQRAGNKNGKFRSQSSQSTRNNKNSRVKNGVKKRLITNKVRDARQKIIQKKRRTVVDARDILVRMAKTRDARQKINRIRDGRTSSQPHNTSVKLISTNILKKTDRNGKISLITNKTKQKSDMNVTIQKQLGLIPNSRSPLRRSQPKRQTNNTNVSTKAVNIRKTILNEMDYPPSEPLRSYDPAVYKWTNPEIRPHPASHLINTLETRQAVREAVREELSNEWPTFASHSKYYRPFRFQPTTAYVDLAQVDDEEMPLATSRTNMALQGTSRVSNVRSRLDGVPQQESHGIFSQQRAKVVVPAGHRIVVSNLQSTVTQDDIKELFEDIGQLLAAKLVRPGVAEVIYKNLKDAQKAVDTYHNRQLDGQPMKCLLVNKRPLNHPTAPAIKAESPLRKLSATVPECPPNNKLVPDIDTIHKVLFQRK